MRGRHCENRKSKYLLLTDATTSLHKILGCILLDASYSLPMDSIQHGGLFLRVAIGTDGWCDTLVRISVYWFEELSSSSL